MRRLTERSESIAKLIPEGAAWDALLGDIYVEKIKDAIGRVSSAPDDTVTALFDAALKKAQEGGMELTRELADDILEAVVKEVEEDYAQLIDHLSAEIRDQGRMMGHPRLSFSEPDKGTKTEPYDFMIDWI